MKRRGKGSLIVLCLLTAAALIWNVGVAQARPLTGPGSIPDYFETPNWAISPPLTKFMDSLAPLCVDGVNNLGQCIPVAAPDITTYPDSDYYEIELVQYREQMHSQLPVLNNADKMAATSGGTLLRGYRQTNTTDANLLTPHYLGPLIIAQKDRPVRIKFTNKLPIGAGGNLFVPVDTSIMGAGEFQINYDPATGVTTSTLTNGTFTQNRAELHLHGGRTPWISDGTPHQWITPAGDPNAVQYPKGVSVKNVPDMPDPGPGSVTYYYTNQQSARLMFYHDHAWGITRLNVYVGEAAGYLITDPVEDALVNGGIVNGRDYGTGGIIPKDQIPLVIQDKTFVNADPISGVSVMATDPTWNWGSTPGTPVTGDLWWPHVYMPAQNPFNPDLSGINAMGRWHYGPWFFPSTPVCGSSPDAVPPFCVEFGPVPNEYATAANPGQPPFRPGTPNVSWGAEAFLDTMMVNGTVYPKLAVDPKQYRLRVLNASHDRFLNLQMYRAVPIVSGVSLVGAGSGYTRAPAVTITPDPADPNAAIARGATARATIDTVSRQVTGLALVTVGSGYTLPPIVTIAPPRTVGGVPATAVATVYTALTEVGMVPAFPDPANPETWPADGREGGVPDPDTAGPAFIHIGSEGGFLPKPAVLPNQPVVWNLDPTMFNFGNVLQQTEGGGTLFLGPAERADVIVDFTNFAGQTLILYNDAPTAFPALDPHYDYYTGAPDRTDIGANKFIPPGVGPNIRTVMQINVGGSGGLAPWDDYNVNTLLALESAFATDATTPGAFESSQEPIVVGQTAYDTTYNTTFPATWPNWGISRISDGAINFSDVDGNITTNFAMKPKAIHDEMGATFDDYGRMSAKLGLEMPFTNAAIANFILQNYVDPSTEILDPNQIQIWRITHNGVDTHPIHFHLFDVQVLNRVGWDGFIRMPDPSELGWKDTVRMSPLEDTIVALRPIAPEVTFGLPKSIRPLNPRYPVGTGNTLGFSQIDTTDGGNLVPLQTNVMTDFDNEYVWHCHILSHEENDMMRPMIFRAATVVPPAPTGLGTSRAGGAVSLSWTDPTAAADPATLGNPANEFKFRIERATGAGVFSAIGNALANATSYKDAAPGVNTFRYRVVAVNAAGEAASTAGCSLVGDVNGDGFVNVVDLGIVRQNQGQTGQNLPSDLNGDGFVNVVDLGIVRSRQGTTCP